MTEKIGKGTVVVYIEQIVNAVCSFFISILLARYFSTTDYGLWKLFASVTILFTFTSSFGIEVSLIRYIPEFLIKKQFAWINKLISYSVTVRILVLLILFIAVYTNRATLDTSFKTGVLFQDLIVPTFGYLTIYHINTIIGRSILTAYGLRYLLGYIKIATKILSLAGIYLITDMKLGFKEVLQLLLLIQTIELLIFLLISGKKIKYNVFEKSFLDKTVFPSRRILAFSLPNYFFLSGQVFRDYTVDNFVISHYLTLEDVAFYGVAIAFPTYFRNFSPGRMLHGVLLPEFVKNYTLDPSKEKLQFGFSFLQKINIVILWPAYLVFILLAGEIITFVYGENYVYSVFPAQLLLIFSIVQTLSDPFYLICNTIEKSNIVFQTTIWGLINLLGNLVLVPKYGIEGAAIATGVTSVFIYIHFYYALKLIGKFNLTIQLKSTFKVLLGLIPTFLFLVAFKYFSLNIFWMIPMIIVSVLLYLISILFFSFFNHKELKILIHSLRFNEKKWFKHFLKT
jgi:O-antigen/teichoic acid export membrane protein